MNYNLSNTVGMSENMRENIKASSDLRLFLLGNFGCGKTSTANTILNQPSSRSVDDAKSCKLREAVTEGRRVALVEAPRWYWAGEKVDDSVRKETEEAVTLVEPGPHAVLLLVPVNQFTEMEYRVPGELQEMFGQEVLDHTLVLLTCGDYLIGRTIEEYLQKEDPGLRQMIKACGGNFHVLNNRNPKDREQVSELLEKVDRMVEKKGVFNMKTAEMREFENLEEKEEEDEEEEVVVVEEDEEEEDEEEDEEEEDEEDEEEDEEDEEDEDDEVKRLLEFIQGQEEGCLGTSELETVAEEEEEEGDEEEEEDEKEEDEEEEERSVEQEINETDKLVDEVQVPNGLPSTREPDLQSHSESSNELNSTPSSLKADGALLSKISDFMTSSRTPAFLQNRSSSLDGPDSQMSPVFSNPHSPILSSTPQPISNASASASVCSTSFSSAPSPSTSSSPGLRLVLLGRSGAGKSSVGNSILGQNVFRSEPNSFTAVTQKCEKRKAVVEGQKVAVVDTSDWFNAEQTPEEVRAQISSCVALSSPGPHAFLLCVPLDQPAKTELQALEALKKVFGPDAVTKHTIVLFTHADRLRDSGMIGSGGVEAYIADQRGDLLKLIEKCRDRLHIMERGQSEMKSVADLLALVALTIKEAGGQYFSSPAFQEAENKVKQKQQEMARERREKRLDQKAVKSGQPLSPNSMNLQPYMQTLFETEELDEIEEIRDEAEMSVSLTSIDCIPLFTMSDLSPSLLNSLKEKVESGIKMVPKQMADRSVQLEEARKDQSSPVWAIQKMVADGSLWGKVGATAGHVSKAVGDKFPKVVADAWWWQGSPMWEKIGASTKTGAKLVAGGSLRVGAGIGAGAKQVVQSPVWGKMGSGAKAGVTMVAESSLWERIGNTVRQVPKTVFAAGLLGLLLGVFFGGLFWGVVGATAGSAGSEMARQKFINRSSSEVKSEAARNMEESISNSVDRGKSLKSE